MNSIEFKTGLKGQLGDRYFSEEEIISYATQFDPLSFHIDPIKAKESQFKKIIASGSQAFKVMYAEFWVPIFGKTVLAGLSVNHWNFILPTYANETITGQYEIKSILNTNKPNELIIKWKFSFFNNKKELVQSLEIKILHNKDLI